MYDRDEGARVARERGWTLAQDGDGVRRVVASPEPRAVRELGAIRKLVETGVVVVCAGGGGVPVVVEGGAVHGVPAAVDKDLTSSLLAIGLSADVVIPLTDVPAVYVDWPESAAVPRSGIGLQMVASQGVATALYLRSFLGAVRRAAPAARDLHRPVPGDLRRLVRLGLPIGGKWLASEIFHKVLGSEYKVISAPAKESWFEVNDWWKRRRDRSIVLNEFSKYIWLWIFGVQEKV